MQEPPKKILTTGAREKLLGGARQIYEAVSSTLGPRSSNVAIERPFGRPSVIHDGVGVSRSSIPLEDPEENVGAEIIFDAADKTNGIGDGTTSATILTYEIAKAAHKHITAGARIMALRDGIETATDSVLKELESMATPINKPEEILRVATISAQNEEIGKMVADAYEELGPEGILTVEESRSTDSYLELKQGMQFDRGWISPHFVAKNSKHKEATLNDPYILVTDAKIRSIEGFAQMLDRLFGEEVKAVTNGGTPPAILIIADQLDGEALGFFVYNHLKGHIQGLAVPAPLFGEKRIDLLNDICVVTGATLVSESTGNGMQSVTKDMLGRASKVTSTKDNTLIVQGAGAEEDVSLRIEELKEKLTDGDLSEYDREKINERLAKLSSGVGVLNIGAKSESELKERKERAIDAISAAKAAISGGIVPGGGMALITAATTVKENLKSENADVQFGMNIVLEACKTPFRKLLSNAGYDPGEYWAKVQTEPLGHGVDVTTGEIKDMIKAGIIDPVLVVTAALGNAVSAASSIYTSDTIITTIREKK